MWEVACGVPHPRLCPGVREYRGFRFDLGRPRRRLEVPAGVVTVVLGFAGTVRTGPATRTPRRERVLGSLVSGLHMDATVGEHDGRLAGVEFTLLPWMAFTVFGVRMRELANAIVEPAELGITSDGLLDALAGAVGWEQRFAMLDAALIRWCEVGVRHDPRIAAAWQMLSDTAGAVPVPALADKVELSQRQLERLFQEQIGLSPKAAARVLRLRRALSLLRHDGSLADVAVNCGFYDQAHLCRECTAMTGHPPAWFQPLGTAPPAGPGRPDRVAGELTSIVLL
jgi:AraC-like DNA-binding protein